MRSTPCARRPHPRLPRPQRRRPVRRCLRDGLRRPRRRGAQRRHAGHRGDGISDSRAEYGDAKNWANQVSARAEELTLKALFNEKLGVLLQVRTEERNEVMQVLRTHGLSSTATSWARRVPPIRRSTSARARCRSGATPDGVQRSWPTCTRSGTASAGRSASSATTRRARTASMRRRGSGGSGIACVLAAAPHPSPLPQGRGSNTALQAEGSARLSPACGRGQG